MSNKLTCYDHGRRVLVISGRENQPIAVHRTGLHEKCDSDMLTICGSLYTPTEILKRSLTEKSVR